ncbi:unnamed protein product, partial [Didymodactylos carnosus]
KTINREGKGEFSIQVWQFKQTNPHLYMELFEKYGWTVENDSQQPIMYFKGKTGNALKDEIRRGFTSSTYANKIKQNSPILGPLVYSTKNIEFQRKQVDDFVYRLNDVVLKIKPSNEYASTLGDYLKSTLGKAIVLDHHVNRPAYVKRDFGKALNRFFEQNEHASRNPYDWNDKHFEYEMKILDDYGINREMSGNVAP